MKFCPLHGTSGTKCGCWKKDFDTAKPMDPFLKEFHKDEWVYTMPTMFTASMFGGMDLSKEPDFTAVASFGMAKFPTEAEVDLMFVELLHQFRTMKLSRIEQEDLAAIN